MKTKNTPVRNTLINILNKNRKPLTPQEILENFSKKKLPVNKTTIYRQLESLLEEGFVEEIILNDRSKRYEIIHNEHHHHLVCLNCKKIEEVSFPKDLEEQEKIVWKKNKFKVLKHSLEFFGVCKECQK